MARVRYGTVHLTVFNVRRFTALYAARHAQAFGVAPEVFDCFEVGGEIQGCEASVDVHLRTLRPVLTGRLARVEATFHANGSCWYRTHLTATARFGDWAALADDMVARVKVVAHLRKVGQHQRAQELALAA